jgi:hypothetical protein
VTDTGIIVASIFLAIGMWAGGYALNCGFHELGHVIGHGVFGILNKIHEDGKL